MSHTEEVAFSIITEAGEGRAKIKEALSYARQGDFAKADHSLQEADTHFLKAHRLQTEELLKKEADGSLQDPFNVLIAHAQDYVMTGMAMRDMGEEMIHLYRRLPQ